MNSLHYFVVVKTQQLAISWKEISLCILPTSPSW